MSPLPPFFALLRRLAPFWLVWALVLALPVSREPLRMQLQGMPLTLNSNPSGYASGWNEYAGGESRFDSFAAVVRNPDDLNARVWRLAQMMDGKAAGWDKDTGEQNQAIYPFATLLTEAEAIRDEFPREKWLISLPPRVVRRGALRDRIPLEEGSRFAAIVAQAERLEARNAYYALLEAHIWRGGGNPDAMRAALNRAAQGKLYDSHNLEWARAIVNAHDAARPLIWEEKLALWQTLLAGEEVIPNYWWARLGKQARIEQKRGNHRRAIEIGVILGSVGDLMQRGKNSIAMAKLGNTWKEAAETLSFRDWPPKPATKPVRWARNFSTYARAHGRPDVEALSLKWLMRQRQLYQTAVFWSAMVGTTPPKDAAARAREWSIAGAVVGVHLLLVAAAWLLVNGILWRGVGAPAPRKDRVFPALCMALLTLGMALWSWRQFELLDAAPWNPTKERFQIAVTTVAIAAFFGAPFLLAVWAAGATLWRSKAEFLKPARIDTELRLNARQSTILRSGPALFCIASLVCTLGFWLLYLALVAFGITSLDLLGWLPDDGRRTAWNLTVPTEALFAPIIYCLFLDLAGFLVWFNKWRYYAGRDSRPITHGGLRAWKEMLGIYLVFGSAIYLGVALVGWPLRAQAARELEIKMVRGELPI